MNMTISVLVWFLLSLCMQHAVAINSVTSRKGCYVAKEKFLISFNVTFPQLGDLIGIVKVGTNVVVRNAPTCIATPCNAPPQSGTISIAESLALGVYKAVLLRSNKQTILATSSTFRIQSTCGTSAPTKKPTIRPTKAPTRSPTKKPTMPTTKSPTRLPTPPPTGSPTSFTNNEAAHQILQQARAVIADMVRANSRLTPEFLRMGFHDCIHVCDGCIDMTNSDNAGLAHPISVLEPVVKQFENKNIGVSRADIWAMAVTVGADVADHGSLPTPINFHMNWFGRVNCEDANQVCHNMAGDVVPCVFDIGPSRHMAAPTLNSEGVLSYFATEFGFDARQTVAIMGAHTVGRLLSNESGIDGELGWTFDHVTLQNEYYNALVGSATSTTPMDQITNLSPPWQRVYRNNSGSPFADKNTWGLAVGGKPLVMLNTDIGFVRELNETVMNSATGAVKCVFNEATATNESPMVCPISTTTLPFVTEFNDSNEKWLIAFRDTLDLMLTNGYNRIPCDGSSCPLTLVPGINDPPPLAPTGGSIMPTTTTPSSGPMMMLSNNPPTTAPSPPPQTSAPSSTPTMLAPMMMMLSTRPPATAPPPPTSTPSSSRITVTAPVPPPTTAPSTAAPPMMSPTHIAIDLIINTTTTTSAPSTTSPSCTVPSLTPSVVVVMATPPPPTTTKPSMSSPSHQQHQEDIRSPSHRQHQDDEKPMFGNITNMPVHHDTNSNNNVAPTTTPLPEVTDAFHNNVTTTTTTAPVDGPVLQPIQLPSTITTASPTTAVPLQQQPQGPTSSPDP